MKNIIIIIICVSISASAQLLMRKGMLKVGEISYTISSFKNAFPIMITNIYLLLSMICYIISTLVWLIVLSKYEVSFAYGFWGLGFIIVTIFGYFVFNEHITLTRIIGMLLIGFGTYFISKT
jgi:multidrug transporter EmrE-like cation transporter